MDTRSKRKWTSPPLKEEDAAAFRAAMAKHRYTPDQVLPHGSYLMNLGSPNAEVHEKSRACLLAELERCGALGLHLYNFHPGSTCGLMSKEECMGKIAAALNEAHAQTKHLNGGRGVVTVLECMAGQGGVVGCTFAELKYIIDRVDDKSRVGVCIDTCHAFAAGIDLRTAADVKSMLADFDSTIGLAYLRGLHFNDSKGELNCRKDRHENIGEGCIGLAGFRALMASDALDHLPIILETPCADLKQARAKYANEIAALYALEPHALKETRVGRPLPFHQPSADEIDEQKQLKKEKAAQRKKNKLQQDDDEEEGDEADEEEEFEEEAKSSRQKRQKSKSTKGQLKRSASASAAVVAAAAAASNGDESKVKRPPLKRHKSAKARVE
jgi:AP endonuclease-1